MLIVKPNHHRNPQNLVHFSLHPHRFSLFLSFSTTIIPFSLSLAHTSLSSSFDFQAELVRCHEQKMTNTSSSLTTRLTRLLNMIYIKKKKRRRRQRAHACAKDEGKEIPN